MTLIEALDEARFVDLTLPVGAPPMLRTVVRWMQESPALVHELYRAAGVSHPILVQRERDRDRVVAEEPSHHDRVAMITQGAVSPQMMATPIRLFKLLSDDGIPRTMQEIVSVLGVRQGTVSTALARFRSQGVPILSIRSGRTTRYVLRKAEAA